MNCLGMAWDANGREASYEYNSLGQRTARQTADTKETYLLDLTRPYHNLLGMASGADEKAFYWDGNVAAMAERKAAGGMTTQRETADGSRSALHYYLQDELGSPLRVSGYDTPYLTYGYDEFGNDLYDRYSGLEDTTIPNPYTRQGEEQPFGYTGYRHDEVSGTYFAQAREYQPQNGIFTAQDVIKGNGVFPETLNSYGYCWGNPVGLVDRDGKEPENLANELDADFDYSNFWENYKNSQQELPDFSIPKFLPNNENSQQDIFPNIDLNDYLQMNESIETTSNEEKSSTSNRGTITFKGSANANLLIGVYVDIGLSFDRKGNIALQWSYAVPGVDGTRSVGCFDAGVTGGVMITDAEDVYGLLGPSSAIGLSGGCLGYFAFDAISFDKVADLGGDINGFQFAYGPGIGADAHLMETNTKNIGTINRFKLLKIIFNFLKGKDECIER